MAGPALRRLMAEYKRKHSLVHQSLRVFLLIAGKASKANYLRSLLAELTLDPPEGIVAGPVSEDNFFEWEALIA